MSDQPEPQHDQNQSTYPPPVPPAPSSAGYPGAAVAPTGHSTQPYAPPPAPEQYVGPQYSSAPQPYQPYQPRQPYQPPQPPQPYQQYQPPQPYTGYPAQPYAQPRPTSGLAVASLVCGLAGVVLSWLLLPILASIAAVITGHMALKQTRQRPDLAGRGLAIAGLILGYVVVGFLALAMAGGLLAMLTTGAALLPFFFV